MGSQAHPLTDLQMTPLPIPSAEPVQPQPARPPEPLPAQAGYASKTGQAANIISNFLHGMAAGKAYQEQKMMQKAQAETVGSLRQYEFLQSIISNPQQTQEARDKATELLPGAWQRTMDAYKEYLIPSKESQKGKSTIRKVGERLTRGVRAQKPEIISEAQFEMFKQMGTLMKMPRPATVEAEEQQMQKHDMQRRESSMSTAQKDFDEAREMIDGGALRDPDKKLKVLDRVTMGHAVLGNITPKDIESMSDKEKDEYNKKKLAADTLTAEVQKTFAQDALKAYEKQRNGESLTPTEKQVLDSFLPPGKPLDPLSIFMNMKGQEYNNKKIETDVDAYNAFLNNEAKFAVKTKQSEFDIQQQPVKDALRSRWRVTHNGQEPTKDELQSAWLDLYMGAGGTKKAEDYNIKKEQEPVFQSSIHSVATMNNGRWSKFFTDQRKLDKDKKPVGNFDYTVKSRNNFNAEDQKEWDKMAQELAHEMQDHGFSLDQISTVIGREAAERMLKMTPTPDKGPAAAGGIKKVHIRATNPATGEKIDKTVDSTGDPTLLKKDFTDGGWKDVEVEATQ